MLGFVLAPLAGAMLLAIPWLTAPVPDALARYGRGVLIYTLYGAYPLALVVALPAYLAARKRLRPRLLTVVALAGVMVAGPFGFVSYQPVLSGTDSYWSSSGAAYANGAANAAYHRQTLSFLTIIFGVGAASGAVFWLCTFWHGPRSRARAEDLNG